MSAARDGAQTGALEYQLVNRAPLDASSSMCGVFRSFAPRQPRSRPPWSSVMMTTKFGLRAARWALRAALAILAPRKVRLVFMLARYFSMRRRGTDRRAG